MSELAPLHYGRFFAICHVITTVAFGESMVRLMYLRVADPKATLESWVQLGLAVLASMLPSSPRPATETMVLVMALSVASYAYKFTHLVALITGCLDLPGVFVIRPPAAPEEKKAA